MGVPSSVLRMRIAFTAVLVSSLNVTIMRYIWSLKQDFKGGEFRGGKLSNLEYLGLQEGVHEYSDMRFSWAAL